MFNPDNTKGF